MKTRSRVLISIALSLAVSGLIASVIFFVLREMSTEVERGRIYDAIISRTHSMNLLLARYKSEPDTGYLRQVDGTRRSLEKLLSQMASFDPSEGLLIRHLRANCQDIGYSLDRLIAPPGGAGAGSIESERRNVLVSQLWLKSQFISDDTNRLIDMSRSRLELAQTRAVNLVLALITLLIVLNAAISFLSGRSIKRAEATTREQREWFRVTLTSIGDAVLTTDMKGAVTFLNPVAVSLTGWALHEATGRPVRDVFNILNEKTRGPAEDIVSRVLKEGCVVSLANHTALISRDGREIPIEDSAAPITDRAGNLIGAVLVFHDVTEKRRAHEMLRESEEFNRRIIESSSDCIKVLDLDGRLLSMSARGQKLFEIDDITAYLNSSWIDFWQESDRQVAAEALAAARAGGKGELQAYCPSAKGTPQWWDVSITPMLGPDGTPERLLCVSREITERKRMELELLRSEAELRLLSETASKLLASENPQAIVNELCQSVMSHLDCQAFFNFMVEEELGKLRLNAYAGIPEEEARKIEWLDFGVAVCGCAARDRMRIVAEDIFHSPDIRTDLVRSYGIQAYACHPLMVGGEVIGTLSFGTKTKPAFSAQDLSVMKTVADQVAVAMERIRLIEGLRSSRDELDLRVRERTAELSATVARLELLNQELQEFAHVASHDLQEPLRKIQTFCGLAMKRSALSEDGASRDYLERVHSSATRMRKLLRDLLAFSRVATRPEPFKEVDLGKVVREAADVFERKLEEEGAVVEIEDLPGIEADETQILRLFQNLIGNALKFRGEKSPLIKIRGSHNGQGWIEVSVTDNGIGFEPQFADRIFKPFQRLHTRSQYEGTGMGLAICRKIAERHGGSIRAESEPGKGSTFTIRLPVKQDRWEAR